jgi:exonuclease VII large subunit
LQQQQHLQQLLHQQQQFQPSQQQNLQQQLLHQRQQPLQQQQLQPLQQQQAIYMRVWPVPRGVPLPPKPPIPPTNDCYELKKIVGNISKCSGCGNAFKSPGVHPPDNTIVICRKERDYYPHVNDDGSKSWHLGRSQNKHYHLSSECIRRRNPTFQPAQLLPVVCNTQITDDLRRVLRTRFGITV